jgi:hypothetical protein
MKEKRNWNCQVILTIGVAILLGIDVAQFLINKDNQKTFNRELVIFKKARTECIEKISSLELEIKQLTCDHGSLEYANESYLVYRPESGLNAIGLYYAKCSKCGKVIKVYSSLKEYLAAKLAVQK